MIVHHHALFCILMFLSAIVRPKVESQLSIQDRHPARMSYPIDNTRAKLTYIQVLFIDLLNNYDAILPPTINRKKRESERKVPIRKRTAPIDMRLSRSRISLGADTQQLLAAQQIAQNPSLGKSVKSPELPGLPLPPVISRASAPTLPPPPPPFVPPPPPPVVETFSPPPPPPVVPPSSMPRFKEPPPEVEDYPARPKFKEPLPEPDSPPHTRPTFVDPPYEESETPSHVRSRIKAPPPPITSVIPPTPRKRMSISSGTASPPPTRTKATSRSPSPPEDQVIASGRPSVNRTGSAGLRGPRLSRAPRIAGGGGGGGGNVSNMVSSLNNRNGVPGSPPPGSPLSSRTANRLSGSPASRPSSVLGRSGLLSRRTMASDAEDDIVEKK